MTTLITAETAHSPVGNPRPADSKRFLSAAPSLGTLQTVNALHPAGHHDVAEFRLGRRTTPAAQAVRAVRELSFGPTPVRGLAPDAVAAGASGAVPVADTTQYPWRATAALKITIPGLGDEFYGTGWFIGPYAIITAAHVVYPRIGAAGQWASKIEVFPGLNGFEATPPYGSVVSDTFYCPRGWQSEGDARLDYGAIILDRDIGATVGTFGYSAYTDADLRASLANIDGYPVVAPDGTTPQGHLWYAAAPVANLDESFVYYELDTRDGDSGSCVYRNSGANSFAMAIHTGAAGPLDRGVRITSPVFANLQTWASMQG